MVESLNGVLCDWNTGTRGFLATYKSNELSVESCRCHKEYAMLKNAGTSHCLVSSVAPTMYG